MSNRVFLLTNLGSPDSTAVGDVRRYLNEFLMDAKVIDIPLIPRYLLVKGIISPLRAYSSAKKYKTIWTDKGSPLVSMTADLGKMVEKSASIPTYFSMRYGKHKSSEVLNQIILEHSNIEELIVIPMYPHYAMSSYETAVKDVYDAYKKSNADYEIKFVPPYYNNPTYIQALAKSIEPYLRADDDLVLFSYHGIPERHVKKTDITQNHCLLQKECCSTSSEAHQFCYRHQVKLTTELTSQYLGLRPENVMFSFQSRLGKDPWLQPYTAQTLKTLPSKGIKKLVICCPAFVTDCLETLEEIHEEGKEIFLKAGGSRFVTVPCLNLNKSWIDTIVELADKARALHEFSLR